jgi:pimeloyl-ACP methyl ester carboxylesterase
MMRSFVLAVLCSAAALGQPGRTVPVNGMEMYFEERGAGDPLILLHGFSSSGQAWSTVVDDFARVYRVIVPDLRGHGRSTNPSGEFTHRQSARDVLALLDHLGIHRAKAMGISTGGMTLLHLATSQTDRLDAMVLIGATTYFPEQARGIMARSAPDKLTETELARFRKIHPRGDEQIRMLRRQFFHFKDSYEDMMFTPPYLATIRARTLIIHGDRDQFFPVAIPVEMYRSIPNAALWIVPNGDHVPVFGDTRPEFVRSALKFLEDRRE